MTAPNKYVVTVNFLGTLTRGDIVTAKQLPADVKDLLAEKSIRPATDEEAGSKETWVHEGVAPERLIIVHTEDEEAEAPAAAPKPTAKRPSRSKAKKPAAKPTTGPATVPDTTGPVTAPKEVDVKVVTSSTSDTPLPALT